MRMHHRTWNPTNEGLRRHCISQDKGGEREKKTKTMAVCVCKSFFVVERVPVLFNSLFLESLVEAVMYVGAKLCWFL